MLVRPSHARGHTTETLVVEQLLLVQSQDGIRVSRASGPFFRPDSDGVPVLTDLCLRLVDPQTLNNAARVALFTKLGLQNYVPEEVIYLILKKYNKWSNTPLQSYLAPSVFVLASP